MFYFCKKAICDKHLADNKYLKTRTFKKSFMPKAQESAFEKNI
jgi:hypothetical protein